MDRVALYCPKCFSTSTAPRDALDPTGTARVNLLCPDCNAGDFAAPAFFDADGNELDWNEEFGGR